LGNPYNIVLSDEDGTVAIEWGAYGVPETYIIYDNKIIKKIIGPINENSIVEIKMLIQ
jgi:cytochrome c biogenesis protein CcmG/thiol:disulfide interchange protein DsbE